MLTTATVCTSLSQLSAYPVVDLLVLAVVFHGDVRLAASPLDNVAQVGSAFATNCRSAGSTLCPRCEAAAADVSSAGSCRGALDSRRRQRGHRRFPSDCAAVALAHEIASFCHAVLAQKQSLRMALICKLLKCQKFFRRPRYLHVSGLTLPPVPTRTCHTNRSHLDQLKNPQAARRISATVSEVPTPDRRQ